VAAAALAVSALAVATPVSGQGTDDTPSPRPAAEVLAVPGLEGEVEILRDRWGIAHIYADSEHDLFFAQGWSAARDRLFQLEIWRRQATGTVAEILGERELERDVGTRLFRYRGDLDEELRHYHPRGPEIIGAFVAGINAYVDAALADPSLLSVEFEMVGILPGRWTPEVVISRHQGLLGNINSELRYGRAVAVLGPERVQEVAAFPRSPRLALDPAVDGRHLVDHGVLRLYNAFRGPVRFRPEDVAPEYRPEDGEGAAQAVNHAARVASAFGRVATAEGPGPYDPRGELGSNNWVVSGRLSSSGFPLMANDPHRVQAAPSLRYWVHLVGPGWNVIGGGEPVLPGVSIGHNEHGAWGLTVFQTDSEDLYVYELDPDDPDRYRYGGGWERMRVVVDTIPVRDRDPEVVELRYTRHGPVTYVDAEAGVAYAVRAAWMEPGGAPYLASLRMDQATTWEEFREACTWSNIPGENMVWAGRDGTIGWQAVGIAPIRRSWSGLVPVPGDGRYEWDGFLPIAEKPHVVNPAEGFFATANNDLTPRVYGGPGQPEYRHWDAIGYEWSAPYRWLRAAEVLATGRRFGIADMTALQTDELSIPARTLVPLLEHVRSTDPASEAARELLLEWNRVLDRESVAAGVYVAWERTLTRRAADTMVPPEAREWLGSPPMTEIVERLLAPDGAFGDDPVQGRDRVVLAALEEAVAGLAERLGSDMGGWVYGQPDYKHIRLRHPLSGAVRRAWRDSLEVGPAPRGGNQHTLNQTSGSNNQGSGASFRIIVDTGNWDAAVGMNNPGQGGHPGHPHYADLFDLWAADRFHPVLFSREKVEGVTGERWLLRPGR
jgi:penicillin amidase